ncbi:HAMP domain-containing protein [Streptomyces polyrhachis]|uniref:HAMP domain-containing protein n=1 Tax=Streptomyces polyrhachis TaxID=1282885 RepID=A0ABW2GD30_9ACTN
MAASRAPRRHKIRRRADMSLVGGIRPPIALLCVLLLAVAALTAFSLGRDDRPRVAEAVLASQQHFAEDGAIALRASLDEGMTDLGRTAAQLNAGPAAQPDEVLDQLGDVYQKWRGTAILEIESGRLLAARGETVPLPAVDTAKMSGEKGLAPRMVRLENGETRLLTFSLLSWPGTPQQLLVASSSLRFPGIALGNFRAIAVLDSTGQILSTDGIPEPEQVLTDLQREEVKNSHRQLRSFAKRAVQQADRHPLRSKEPGAGGYLGTSGRLTGDKYLGERFVAGYAALAAPKAGEFTDATGLGLTVVAMVPVTEDTRNPAGPLFGLASAGALLAIGAVVAALLLGLLQRPLLRLFLESRRLGRGELRRPVAVPGCAETARIGAALERLRRQLLGDDPGDPPPAQRVRRPGARTLLVLCTVLLLAWSAALGLGLNRADSELIVPQQVVNDQRERTDTLTDRTRRALNEGHSDLASFASFLSADSGRPGLEKDLGLLMNEHMRYRSVYLLDADGTVVARAGGQPTTRRLPDRAGITLLNQSGREPEIAAVTKVPARKGARLVGEFRIGFLNSLLKAPGLGEVRVVDSQLRVIAGDTGYRAFERLDSTDLDDLVIGSRIKVGISAKAGSAMFRDGGRVSIAAAAPFVGGGAAKSLGWTVVSWQPASALAIPEYRLQNRTTLAGLLGLTAAAACLGWLQIVIVRPLRTLARQAEELADGDRRTVLFPHNHDEVGAVARSLELIRQQLQQQPRHTATPAGRS